MSRKRGLLNGDPLFFLVEALVPNADRRTRLTIASEPRLKQPKTQFGEKFHRWLSKRGVKTMGDAAILVGFSRHTVLLWRRGDREPSSAAKRLLESYFNGSVTPPGAAQLN
jgi:DNA-binding transcriptional regulator YiaG